ncbi:MAG: tRNA 2-thiouridine(34) synthase MnmA [Clostridia bacterium]|nr:tRNA 2-thiouridine(34) synthase MnmA [Clostridia bacterium]
MESNQKIVVVGMSGGVDSSVSALLLKKQGYKVIGLHMKGENPETREDDETRVRKLCSQLDIDLEVVDYSQNMQLVKDYFVNEYLAGRTPNPCVVCNREVKFKPFIEFANKLGADYFATGHYARIEHNNGKHILKKAIDTDKDQSYFLCQLSQKQLEKALFPLGELTKQEVRRIAEENNLISSKTKDSYDVCFIGSSKFKTFMESNYPEKAGDIVDIKTGGTVGKHTGISKYTIGQRKGLGVGGKSGSNGQSWFVVKKDVKNNILYVSQGEGDALNSKALISNNMNWLIKEPDENVIKAKAKFRYRQEDQEVLVYKLEKNKVRIEFEKPQRAVTVGQYAVLYNDDVCIGGAVIDEVIN